MNNLNFLGYDDWFRIKYWYTFSCPLHILIICFITFTKITLSFWEFQQTLKLYIW